MSDDTHLELAALTADIVSAYVSNNEVDASALASLIGDVHLALSSAGQPAASADPEPAKLTAAEIRKSRTPDYLISFIDGRPYKSLKRHLGVNGMTPEEYRSRYGLPEDYPMVAPAYSAQRSALAKSRGLGRRAAPAEIVASEPEAAPERQSAPKKGRGKAKAAEDVAAS